MQEPTLHPPHVVPTGHRWDARIEVTIAVVLGLAAIAGAFTAYKREGREHKATVAFNRGTAALTESAQFYTQGNQVFTSDNAQFLEYAKAANSNQPGVARYLLDDIMSPQLRAGVIWWSNQSGKNSPATPFVPQNPKYDIPEYAKGAELDKRSNELFEQAKGQQEKADRYTLIEVIIASALFLYGIAGVTRNFRIKLGALGAGATIFALSMALLVSV